jgi:Helix-turn-helix domain
MDDPAQSPSHHVVVTPGAASVCDRDATSTEPGDALVNEGTAAAILAVPPRTLQWWRLTRKGPPAVVLSPRTIRYRRSDLARWINARLQTTPSVVAAGDLCKSDGPPDEAA